MNIDSNLTTKLANIANISNTVGGGMVETNTSLTKNEDHYLISINVPGITDDELQVEINNDLVLVFLNIEIDGNEPFNYLMKYFKIPFEVDSEQIWADYEDHYLNIVMPFKELTDGYFRTVKINS